MNGPLAFDVHHEVCVRRVLVGRQHLVDLVPAPVEDVDARGDHLGRRRVRRHERGRQQVLQVRPLAVTVWNVSCFPQYFFLEVLSTCCLVIN